MTNEMERLVFLRFQKSIFFSFFKRGFYTSPPPPPPLWMLAVAAFFVFFCFCFNRNTSLFSWFPLVLPRSNPGLGENFVCARGGGYFVLFQSWLLIRGAYLSRPESALSLSVSLCQFSPLTPSCAFLSAPPLLKISVQFYWVFSYYY